MKPLNEMTVDELLLEGGCRPDCFGFSTLIRTDTLSELIRRAKVAEQMKEIIIGNSWKGITNKKAIEKLKELIK